MTISFGVYLVLWLFVLYFVMCGRFDNCVGVFVICVIVSTLFCIFCTVFCFVLFRLCIFILISFVCTVVRTTATE